VRRSAGIFLIIYAFVLSMTGLLSATSVSALNNGLAVTVYNNFGYNGAPPLPSVSGRPQVGQMTVSRVQQNFDQSPPFGMYEDFIVRYEGYITPQVSGSFRFWPQADDGTKLYIDDLLIQNDWRDKGGGGALSSYVTFEAGVSKKFEMWFYENGGGAWTTLYWDIGNGWEIVPDSAFTTDFVAPSTTLAPYLNVPSNVQITSRTESGVSLSWDAPEQSNADVERYAVMWSCENNWDAAYGIAAYITEATISGLEPETSCIFQVRADNYTIPVYSGWSQSVSGVTETTTTTSTTTTTIPETTTTTTTEAPVEETTPVETSPSQSDTTSDEPTTSVPQYASEQETTTTTEPPQVETDAESQVANLDTESISTEALANVVSSVLDEVASAEELGNVVDDLLDKPLTDEQFAAVIDEVFSEPLSAEELTNVLDAVFDEPISDEKFDEVISNVLEQPLTDEQFAAVVDVLENDSITAEQVASAVDAVLEAGVSEDQATELATSEKVLESIDGEQATEIFDTIDADALSDENAAEIIDAVQDAPEEVRNAFQEEIDIFGTGKFDNYVPIDSNVTVSGRRTIIAAATGAVLALPTAAGGATGSSGPSGGTSGGSGGGSASSDRRRLGSAKP
jgi:hypothetical protein